MTELHFCFAKCICHCATLFFVFFFFWIIHEKRIRHNQHALTETQSKGCFPNALAETQKLWFPKCFDWNSIKGVASQTFLLSDFSLIHLLVPAHLSSLLLSSNCLLHRETSLHTRFPQQRETWYLDGKSFCCWVRFRPLHQGIYFTSLRWRTPCEKAANLRGIIFKICTSSLNEQWQRDGIEKDYYYCCYLLLLAGS